MGEEDDQNQCDYDGDLQCTWQKAETYREGGIE